MTASTSATTGGSLRPQWRPVGVIRTWAAAAVQPLHGALETWAERRRVRQTIAELRALSDDTLKDIGLDRADIEFVALQCSSRHRPRQ